MLVDTFARYWKHYINVHIYTRPVDGRGSKQYTLYVYTYIYNIIIIIVRATAYLSFVWLCVYMRLVQVRACTYGGCNCHILAFLYWQCSPRLSMRPAYSDPAAWHQVIIMAHAFLALYTQSSQDTHTSKQLMTRTAVQWVYVRIRKDSVLTVPAFLVFVTPEVLVTYFLFVKLIFYAGRGILTHIIQRIQIPKCRWWYLRIHI